MKSVKCFFFLLILISFGATTSYAQQQRKYRNHEEIELQNGLKVEVLRSRGEGDAEELDVIYFTEKRQTGKRMWQSASILRGEERAALIARGVKVETEKPASTTKKTTEPVVKKTPEKAVDEAPVNKTTVEKTTPKKAEPVVAKEPAPVKKKEEEKFVAPAVMENSDVEPYVLNNKVRQANANAVANESATALKSVEKTIETPVDKTAKVLPTVVTRKVKEVLENAEENAVVKEVAKEVEKPAKVAETFKKEEVAKTTTIASQKTLVKDVVKAPEKPAKSTKTTKKTNEAKTVIQLTEEPKVTLETVKTPERSVEENNAYNERVNNTPYDPKAFAAPIRMDKIKDTLEADFLVNGIQPAKELKATSSIPVTATAEVKQKEQPLVPKPIEVPKVAEVPQKAAEKKEETALLPVTETITHQAEKTTSIIPEVTSRTTSMVGVKVEVNVNGVWKRASVIETEGELLYKVHFDGMSSDNDDWVPPRLTRKQSSGSPATSPMVIPEAEKASPTVLKAGTPVAKNTKQADCNFKAPGTAVKASDNFSESLAKRKIYENYASLAKMSDEAPSNIGVTFQSISTIQPFSNNVNILAGGTVEYTYTKAPAGAFVYPVIAKYIVCEQYATGTKRRMVEANFGCFRNKEGLWSCTMSAAPDEKAID